MSGRRQMESAGLILRDHERSTLHTICPTHVETFQLGPTDAGIHVAADKAQLVRSRVESGPDGTALGPAWTRGTRAEMWQYISLVLRPAAVYPHGFMLSTADFLT